PSRLPTARLLRSPIPLQLLVRGVAPPPFHAEGVGAVVEPPRVARDASRRLLRGLNCGIEAGNSPLIERIDRPGETLAPGPLRRLPGRSAYFAAFRLGRQDMPILARGSVCRRRPRRSAQPSGWIAFPS